MKNKKTGFSLIELLVVIVIMAILATISIGTFAGFFERARDAKRTTTVDLMSNLVKSTDATDWSELKYDYRIVSGKNIKTAVLAKNDVVIPPNEDLCYLFAFSGNVATYSADNQFAIIAWSEDQNKPIVSGTANAVSLVNSAALVRTDFSCGTGGNTAAGHIGNGYTSDMFTGDPASVNGLVD